MSSAKGRLLVFHRVGSRQLLAIGAALLCAVVLGAGAEVQPPRSALASGSATQLAFQQEPVGAIAGSAFPVQPVVAVLDAGSSVVTSDNQTLITLQLQGGGGGGTLTCTGGVTQRVVVGVATFLGCTTNKANYYSFGFTIQASANPSLTLATSASFMMSNPTIPLRGLLRVTTSPGVPSQVQVNGIPMDDWALNWVKLPPGIYTVSFSDLIGFTTPAPQTVTVTAGNTTSVQGTFVQKGNLRVVTSPPVPSTISVDGVPRNDWGMWTDLPAGSYQVCFGAVAGFNTPSCQTANLSPGVTTVITGSFSVNAAAPGPAAGYGLLRVQTNPAVPSQILIDGIPRTDWGLDWVKLAPGTYTVSFGGAKDLTSPPPQVVTVTAGNTTTVTGTFITRGWLRVVTSPAVPGTLYVNGLPRDDWGMWTPFEPGSYQVCFGPVTGDISPSCQTQSVVSNTLTTATGSYTPSSCVPGSSVTYSVSGGPVSLTLPHGSSVTISPLEFCPYSDVHIQVSATSSPTALTSVSIVLYNDADAVYPVPAKLISGSANNGVWSGDISANNYTILLHYGYDIVLQNSSTDTDGIGGLPGVTTIRIRVRS